MPHLAIGEANNVDILAFRAVNRAGQLYSPSSVEYVIYSKASGIETQVYPSSGREDVTAQERGVQANGIGIFEARDVALDIGLKPGVSWAASVGLHTIRWFYLDEDGAPCTWDQEFYVSASGLGVGRWSYLSPNELRAEGLSSTVVPDDWMLDLLNRAQDYVDATCRQCFRPVLDRFKMDGHGSSRLLFSQPIIGIEWIRPNYTTQALDRASFQAFVTPTLRASISHPSKDHRRNPKVELLSQPSIYQGGSIGLHGVFVDEPASQEVAGVFGFLESNGTTPKLIREAMLRIVMGTAQRITRGQTNAHSSGGGPLKRLRVDKHEQEWDTGNSAIARHSALAITAEVEEIFQMYRAPINIAMSG